MKDKIVNRFNLATLVVILTFLNGIIKPEMMLVIEILVLLIQLKKIKVNKYFMIGSLVLVLHGLINCFIGNDTLILMSKQLIGIVITFTFYYSFANSENLKEIVKLYVQCSVIIAVIAILQQIAKLIGLTVIYDLRWLIPNQLAPVHSLYRSVAIFTEPSECALILLPTVFLSIYYWLGKNRVKLQGIINKPISIIVVLGYIFTFSSAGYIGVIFTFIAICFEYRREWKKMLFIIITIIIIIVLLYSTLSVFRIRVNDTISSIMNRSDKIEKNNLSTQTISINAKIAIYNLQNTLFLGGGIGSHLIAYNKYINNLNVSDVEILLNKEDANSLLLRIISELGIIGILMTIAFFYYNKCKNKTTLGYVINLMCIVYFLLRLLRYGHYFNDGLWLVVVLYMITAKNNIE